MQKEPDMNKTKIFLLAGFLGSGKTTLLNRVLSWKTGLSDTLVLVNEFGKIGVDGSLIKSQGNDVIEMTSGCICCSIKTKLTDTLKELWAQYKPKKILLEATGVAEPNSVAEVFNDDFLKDRMELSKITTVLDIRYWIGREKFGPFFMNQVQQANLVLLNKIDMVPKDRVGQALSEIHSEIKGCHAVPCIHCDVDPNLFWGTPRSQQLGNFFTVMPNSAIPLKPGDKDNCDTNVFKSARKQITYDTFDFSSEIPFSEICFEDFLKTLPWQLFRIKGTVRFPNCTLMLNYAAGQIDWQRWDDTASTRLAFIGWDIDTAQMMQVIEKCLVR